MVRFIKTQAVPTTLLPDFKRCTIIVPAVATRAYGSGAIVGGGNDNTAVGSGALGVTNVSSNENTALGSRALASNVGQ